MQQIYEAKLEFASFSHKFPKVFLMSVGQRVQLLLNQSGKNAANYAKAIGISHTGLSDIVNSKSQPKFSTLEGLMRITPGLSAHWLLTGEGEMWAGASEGAGHIAVAVGINGPNHQVLGAAPDPCAGVKLENEYLRQQVADKEEIIRLLKTQK